MREILFRGKATENYGKYKIGDWVYGNFMEGMNKNDCCINPKGTCNHIQVDTETVGEYTGLKDRSGYKIFEGDILMMLNDRDRLLCVLWDDEASAFYVVNNDCTYEAGAIERLELFSNKYDEPELLDIRNLKEDDEE